MSEMTSPKTHLKYGVEMVCRVWTFPRSSYYCQSNRKERRKRGRRPSISDSELLESIKRCIKESPFQGEGHRKIHARLKRMQKLSIGRNRVLNIMKGHHLLSPYRYEQTQKKVHDGRITTDRPNEMWCTDAAKIFTLEDGWVWFFGVLEHWNAECLGWHLTKKGDRFAAIESMTQAVTRAFGSTSQGIARGLKLRVDHGSQFVSEGFINQARYWGISLSKGFVGEPETNGVIERFHRTLKEQVVHGRHYHSVMDLQIAMREFIAQYNEHWLLEKLNFHSPLEARRLYDRGLLLTEPRTPISTSLAERREGHGYSVLAAPEDVFKEKREENFTVSLHEEEEHGYSVLAAKNVPSGKAIWQ